MMSQPVSQEELVHMLRTLQSIHFHYPKTDFSDYQTRCNGCGLSPYNTPAHREGCLVVSLGKLLDRVDREEKGK
jgi:hypothetical protein